MHPMHWRKTKNHGSTEWGRIYRETDARCSSLAALETVMMSATRTRSLSRRSRRETIQGSLQFLAYHNPIVSQAVLTTAMPMMPIVIMFAMQYRVAQAEVAAEVFLSSVSSVISMGAFITLTSQLK
jgi:hypothetical protein